MLTASDILFDLAAVTLIHGDTFEMGLATSLSYWQSFGALFCHFFKKNIMLMFSFKEINWKEAGSIMISGMPNGACRLGSSLRTMVLNRLIAVVAASAAVAAYSSQRQADAFLNPLTLGMADTVAMLAYLSGKRTDQ